MRPGHARSKKPCHTQDTFVFLQSEVPLEMGKFYVITHSALVWRSSLTTNILIVQALHHLAADLSRLFDSCPLGGLDVCIFMHLVLPDKNRPKRAPVNYGRDFLPDTLLTIIWPGSTKLGGPPAPKTFYQLQQLKSSQGLGVP